MTCVSSAQELLVRTNMKMYEISNAVLKLEMLKQNWLSDEKVVNFVLAFVSLWSFSGYHIVLFTAALQSVNRDIIEAATLDGANAWQMFRYIQTPSIMLMVDFVLFNNICGAM